MIGTSRTSRILEISLSVWRKETSHMTGRVKDLRITYKTVRAPEVHVQLGNDVTLPEDVRSRFVCGV